MKNRVWFLVIILAIGVAIAVWLTQRGSGDQTQASQPPILKVAAVFPMTGPGASLGEYLKNGVVLAEETIREQYKGKLLVEVEILDSKSQPKEAITALQARIAQDKPHAVIAALSSVANALKPLVEKEGLLTAATTTASADLLEGTNHMFRVYPTSLNFAQPIVGHTAKQYKRVAIMYINDDFGESIHRIFQSLGEKAGMIIVSAEPYQMLQEDTRSLVTKVAATKPDAVYIVGYGPAYTKLFKQFKEQAPRVSLVADISLPNPAVLDALGKDAEGIVFDGTDAELTQPTTAASAAFRRKYRERFGKEPFMVAGFAYDALMLLARASIAKGEFSVPNRETVIALSPYDGIMGRNSLDKRGESDMPLQIMIRQGGSNLPYKEK